MYHKTPKGIIITAFFVVGISIGFGVGFIFAKSLVYDNGVTDLQGLERIFLKNTTFDLIDEGVSIIKSRYVDGREVEVPELVYGAMEGMLEALEDPYSIFLKPKDSKTFEENVNGSFEGIGAEIGIRDKMLSIISPLKNSPAERAGLHAGDRILFVDEVDTKELSLDGAVQIIRGPKGTEVVLTVYRDGEKDNLKISIIRDTIKIPNISWEDRGDNIAYIALYHFTEEATGDFADTVNEILKSDAEKILLDLRNNPGGFLRVSVDIAGWFLESGKVVVTEDRGGRGENTAYKTKGSGALKEFPAVILVNRGSASAAEILAGALRDHRDVQLIGETTFGKGSVQELVKLSDGSSIKITIAKWLTPSGLSIQDNGIEPDTTVEMTQEIFENEGDIQLEKAIEVLRGL